MSVLDSIELKDYEVIKCINGSLMRLDKDKRFGRSLEVELYENGIREKESTQKFTELLLSIKEKCNPLILDLGSNVGYYSLLEARLFPESKIISVEASYENCSRQEFNIKLNGYKNIDLRNIAVGSQKGIGELEIYRTPQRNSMKSLNKNSNLVEKVVEVKIDTVDSILNEDGFFDKDQSIIVRMDVEGYESEVLKGMNKLLDSNKACLIFIEIHPKIVKVSEVFNLLKSKGFNLVYFRNDLLIWDSFKDLIELNLSEMDNLFLSNSHLIMNRNFNLL